MAMQLGGLQSERLLTSATPNAHGTIRADPAVDECRRRALERLGLFLTSEIGLKVLFLWHRGWRHRGGGNDAASKGGAVKRAASGWMQLACIAVPSPLKPKAPRSSFNMTGLPKNSSTSRATTWPLPPAGLTDWQGGSLAPGSGL